MSDLIAQSRAGDNAEPLSVSALSQMLKRTVEDRFGYVRLRGELSGVKRAASGHMYCSLKDEKAVIDGVMWKGTTARLAFQPEDGLEVIATGKLTTYPGRSKYQIVLESLEMAGEGALLALLEKTRQRLEAEGLFARDRKRPLPFLPRTIGVVTSPTGAVIRDILHRLADRFPSHVLVWPVLVQGQGAAEQVSAAIRGFGAIKAGGEVPRPDLLIVARGGGSIEDLWSFNEEMVVRAIADSPIPVISAVGHETDTTLADYAADRRAPTPTAAAEIAVPVKGELAATLNDYAARQQRGVLRPLSLGRERLEARVQRLPTIETLLQPQAQKLDERVERLRGALRDRAAKGREALATQRLSPTMLQRAEREARRKLDQVRLAPALVERRAARDGERLAGLSRVLATLNPRAPLERGYALVRDADGKLVRAKGEATKQARLAVEFADGSLDVVPAGKAAAAPKRVKKSPPPGTSGAQEDLFG
ncbi:exodeoxyribonuclease VII large subunit [Erythrobacter litoralis]|uniref:Exodeoxyribonuclease 7 large subunit n=1 Tax=Erythrobacter litoralis (strain HTCC2594) TaxID=314225 RepID=EX7L_ERYLH|nr:exodeoxyribonuclease VII large subunit [Erythrobacter litoralis]Q2N6Q7.1 RecName: Full=Exodeoxyribonuclease 7 large subunit; AltName: Full=Exodeoxyribonuclease VII large subunit; Short=Exonuclease VII large subunit [Erythrobacter litoralis HTCC2594]ABC64634.1 exodeoxyribonuclease VII large subunit [Erythrobacter litoralis HTCC2594]